MCAFTYKYFRPSVTTDIAVFYTAEDISVPQVLLIQRNNPPFQDHWALPGGFIEEDESLENSALRELKEETGLSLSQLQFFNVYGEPGRDPRGRTITLVYWHLLKGQKPTIQADDDASDARWFELDALPELAFDHLQILTELRQKVL